MQVSPFVGRQLAEESCQGSESRVRGGQALEGADDASRIHAATTAPEAVDEARKSRAEAN